MGKRTAVIRYSGGLGNQMFQYALGRGLSACGFSVLDDLSHYTEHPDAMPFCLDVAFPSVILQEDKGLSEELRQRHAARGSFKKAYHKLFPASRPLYGEARQFRYDPRVFSFREVRLEGFWQSYRYLAPRELLLDEFRFAEVDIPAVTELKAKIESVNSVSLHVRAGDYLLPENQSIFGGICTEEYYRRAIEYISARVENPVFFVFSNDAQWCREHLPLEGAIYVDAAQRGAPDFAEMMLMSRCRHNIIANSSFSFFGAWLNENPEKIVVAPARWVKTVKKDEVCPPEWVRLSSNRE